MSEVMDNSNEDLMPRKGIVLYTDGACRYTNPGYTGWGCHGFLYTTELSKKGNGLSSHLITENGYVPNSADAKATLKQVQVLKYFDFFGSSDVIGSNNAAEVEALVYALSEVIKYDINTISVFTDSEYLRRGLTEWSSIWVSRNWIKADGKPVPNSGIWKCLLEKVKDIKDKGITINISWVKGHNEIFGNVVADLLATVAVNYSLQKVLRNEFKTTDASGYWKKEIKKHPFLFYKQMLFNSVAEFNIPGKYYLAKCEKDDQMDKRTADSCYSVVLMKKPELALEIIRDTQYKLSDEINSIMSIRLDKVFSNEVYDYILEHGEYSLLKTKNSLTLNFLDDKPLSEEINPPGKAIRVIENISYIEEVLYDFLYKDNQYADEDPIKESKLRNNSFSISDVTYMFYDVVTKDKKGVKFEQNAVKKIFTTDDSVSLSVNTIVRGKECTLKVPVILGIDLLSRNGLKAIEDKNPRICLVMWKESEKCFKYAVVVSTDEAVGIWSNLFANNIVLT